MVNFTGIDITGASNFLGGIVNFIEFIGNNISSLVDFVISILIFLLTNLIAITNILILLPYWILLFLTHLPIFIVWIEGILTAMAYFNGKKIFYVMLNLWGHYNIILARSLIIGFTASLKFTINTIIRIINMGMKFVFGTIEAIPIIQ